MDEPLSNLDAKLRIEMRGEIRTLQQKMGITTIYVTHDQEEALSISDRIAVMDQGVIRQVGKPWEIYTKPKDPFVAGFIGATNMLQGEVVESRGNVLMARCGTISLCLSKLAYAEPGTRLQIAIRPEAFRIAEREEAIPEGHWPVEGYVSRVEYLGNMIKYEVEFSEDTKLLITNYEADPSKLRRVGEQLRVFYPIEHAWFFQEDQQR
jgi:ABC-type Fe3+/spermidine/putrescine transport system ATPase subunit